MGPNGAGKSTLANCIFNNPEYTKISGKIDFEGENINDLSTDKIAKKGIFMSFQSPEEIPGISCLNFLKTAKNKIQEKPVKIFEFKDTVKKYVEELNMNVDAIRTVSKGIEMYKSSENAVLIITHNMRILENLKVDFVHILVDGKIVKTGNADLAKEIEQEGYEKYKKVEV